MRVVLLAVVLAAAMADKPAAEEAEVAVPKLEKSKEPTKHASEKHHSKEEEEEERHSEVASKHKEHEKEANGTKHGDGCQCECSWVSKDKKVDMCAADGDHSCCWHVCCKGFGGFTVTSTGTSSTSTVTHTTTQTVTLTKTTTETATETTTKTETVTRTSTRTGTTTSTNTATGTETTTTVTTTSKTATATTTSTTTEYCFEDDIFWDPLDMPSSLPKIEADAFACQRRCLRTEGCSHFSFHKMTSMCHLQDAFAVQRTSQPGYMSGPFQCGSYIKGEMFTKVLGNSYLPKEFRCMQTGVAYSPDMAMPKHIQGNRSFVVKTCQQRCGDTEGCHFFTVHFPGMCRLAGAGATPLPGMASVMSGPASSEHCDEAGFIMKSSVLRQGRKQHSASSAWPIAAATAAALLGAMAMGVVAVRRTHVDREWLQAVWSLREIDLEESLAGAVSPSSAAE